MRSRFDDDRPEPTAVEKLATEQSGHVHPVDATCPSSEADGWRPSDAATETARFGAKPNDSEHEDERTTGFRGEESP